MKIIESYTNGIDLQDKIIQSYVMGLKREKKQLKDLLDDERWASTESQDHKEARRYTRNRITIINKQLRLL